MTTLAGGALPIPEQVIVGTGAFVVPVDRYGFLSMSTTVAGSWAVYQPGNGDGISRGFSGSGNANSNHQWINEGDSISTATSAPATAAPPSSIRHNLVTSFVRINGNNVCLSSLYHSNSQPPGGRVIQVVSNAQAGWSLSLYRKPKGNLPIGAAEGE